MSYVPVTQNTLRDICYRALLADAAATITPTSGWLPAFTLNNMPAPYTGIINVFDGLPLKQPNLKRQEEPMVATLIEDEPQSERRGRASHVSLHVLIEGQLPLFDQQPGAATQTDSTAGVKTQYQVFPWQKYATLLGDAIVGPLRKLFIANGFPIADIGITVKKDATTAYVNVRLEWSIPAFYESPTDLRPTIDPSLTPTPHPNTIVWSDAQPVIEGIDIEKETSYTADISHYPIINTMPQHKRSRFIHVHWQVMKAKDAIIDMNYSRWGGVGTIAAGYGSTMPAVPMPILPSYPAFSASSTYAVDDRVCLTPAVDPVYGGYYYRCLVTISSPGPFNPANWTLAFVYGHSSVSIVNDNCTPILCHVTETWHDTDEDWVDGA